MVDAHCQMYRNYFCRVEFSSLIGKTVCGSSELNSHDPRTPHLAPNVSLSIIVAVTVLFVPDVLRFFLSSCLFSQSPAVSSSCYFPYMTYLPLSHLNALT